MDDEIFESLTADFEFDRYRRIDLGWLVAISPVEDTEGVERELGDSYGG
jgi:hypothetical protein